MQADGRTNMQTDRHAKLIVAFRNFTNAPNKPTFISALSQFPIIILHFCFDRYATEQLHNDLFSPCYGQIY